ncbi:trigger factor [Cesiribacter sp. SM1]|uniref:trigger factor n=1 Tax=Cesiribacter sp. SM1 TaxID=2861196 RepID=UPI001CD60248|nr:trigger factor [Cesiribacter sp. SM1]
MDIQLEKKNPTEASIKITLSEADYQPKVEEKIRDYRKKAQIKGFRPGKVPDSLIRKMYGKAILVDEVNHTLSHALQDYLRDNKINVLGEPLPQREDADAIDWDKQKEFTFTYNIGMAGDFSVKLDEVKVARYSVDVNDALMDETIENIRTQPQLGNSVEVDEYQEGDLVSGELKAEEGDFSHNGLLAPNDLSDDTKKLFKGLKKGDSVSFDIKEAFNNPTALATATGLSPEEAEKLEGDFTFTVEKINRQEPAELNQELFDKVFGPGVVSSEEEFRTKVRETIAENYERESERLTNAKIREELLANTDIELPDDFLKTWLKATNEKVSDEDLEKEYPMFARDLRWTLIQNKLAEENEVKVDPKDVVENVKEGIRQQFRSYGMGDEMEDMLDNYATNYLQDKEGQNYMQVYNKLRHDKVMEVVRQKVQLEENTVTAEEFRNQLQQQ